MLRSLKIIMLCTLMGCLLATLFITPGGAVAGALKGLLLGMVIAWGDWKNSRRVRVVTYLK